MGRTLGLLISLFGSFIRDGVIGKQTFDIEDQADEEDDDHQSGRGGDDGDTRMLLNQNGDIATIAMGDCENEQETTSTNEGNAHETRDGKTKDTLIAGSYFLVCHSDSPSFSIGSSFDSSFAPLAEKASRRILFLVKDHCLLK